MKESHKKLTNAEDAIEEAVKRGYPLKEWKICEGKHIQSAKESVVFLDVVFLDPAFWQALGKARGWEGKCSDCYKGEPHKWCQSGSHLDLEPEKYHNNYPWRVEWHRFIDHLAEGKEINEFFKEL